ncbi:hypothetical protein [Moraxella sp. VT-16-12]|nr:hypothetical protein [Moraxella sp. VT-16-12]
MRFYNENDYLDWLESQHSADELAEREQYEADDDYWHNQTLTQGETP